MKYLKKKNCVTISNEVKYKYILYTRIYTYCYELKKFFFLN